MRGWVAERQAGSVPDRLFLLSHPPVVTYGPRTRPEDLPSEASGLPTVEVDRGGQATYHGPGQLVGYLIANVRDTGPADVVRWMEDGLIAGGRSLGFDLYRRQTSRGGPSLVGVWAPGDRKIGSIGMRIRGGVTSHGFSFNVDPDMAVFGRFVSCGLSEEMTSLHVLAAELGRTPPTPLEVRDALAAALGAHSPAPARP